MTAATIILDVGTVALILVTFFIAMKRGFIRSAVNLLGTAISAVAAYLTCGMAADFLYKTLTRNHMVQAIQTALDAGGAAAEGVTKAITDALSVLGSDAGLTANVQSALQKFSGQSNEVMAQNIADTVVADAMNPMFRAVCFVVLFFLFLIVVRVVSRILSKGVQALPVIGQIDSWLGGLVGLAEGLLLVFIAAVIIAMLPAITGAPLVSAEEIGATYLFKFFYGFLHI